ncbi:protein mono-ADP-ribosyltransferase PARP3 isoform X2 [Rousettus aegyptiacus]|uniref:protein mono-ADP-ribosyltransferase PARP3 isoform X2 n=1 Tax=Rousettus aegyptiacus TaxID=9407 RepID=UPI00168CEBE5|nr:protein mono-ADP-ribosyltransferase PARP3 isoform X2 [Rousettus aegyptiacus]
MGDHPRQAAAAPARTAMTSKHKLAMQHEVPVKKERQEAEEDSFRSTPEALTPAPTENPAAREDSTGARSHPETKPRAYEDYDCTLCQTDIEKNNNKFYTIRLLQEGDSFSCQNLWGRVGEKGNSETENFQSLEAAKKWFETKFRKKTKNAWAQQHCFKPHPGKYKLIEEYREAEAPEAAAGKVRPCSLDVPTQNLIASISSQDMFSDAMALMNLDINKFPVKMLSQRQIARGLEALEKLAEALTTPADADLGLSKLSSDFYTIIPHNFGRQQPPPIDSPRLLQVLDTVVKLVQTQEAALKEEDVEDVPHPLDRAYQLLGCQLQLLDPEEPEYEMIRTHLKETGKHCECLALEHVWKVNREGERDEPQARPKLDNWWNGTNRALVAAILSHGFRIVPHARGFVKNIYSGLQNKPGMAHKADRHVGYMFLGEATLSREHHATVDEPSVTRPAPRFDSVLARGRTEPNLTQDTELNPDSPRVVVAQAQPVLGSSTFSRSEDLTSQRSQRRLCYLLKLHP